MLALTRDYAAQARTASYSGRAPVLNSVYVGALIAMLAAFRLATLRRSAGLSAINAILALWIIASPWVYGYSSNVGAVRGNLLLGIAIATLASWSGSATFFGQDHPPGTPAR